MKYIVKARISFGRIYTPGETIELTDETTVNQLIEANAIEQPGEAPPARGKKTKSSDSPESVDSSSSPPELVSMSIISPS